MAAHGHQPDQSHQQATQVVNLSQNNSVASDLSEQTVSVPDELPIGSYNAIHFDLLTAAGQTHPLIDRFFSAAAAAEQQHCAQLNLNCRPDSSTASDQSQHQQHYHHHAAPPAHQIQTIHYRPIVERNVSPASKSTDSSSNFNLDLGLADDQKVLQQQHNGHSISACTSGNQLQQSYFDDKEITPLVRQKC